MAASLAPECNDIKEQYDSCFLKWYSEKYLRDSSSADECEDLFKKYRKCMEKTLKERGIDTMLEEARKNNKENESHIIHNAQRSTAAHLVTRCRNAL